MTKDDLVQATAETTRARCDQLHADDFEAKAEEMARGIFLDDWSTGYRNLVADIASALREADKAGYERGRRDAASDIGAAFKTASGLPMVDRTEEYPLVLKG